MAPLSIVLGFSLYEVLVPKKLASINRSAFLAGGTPFEELVSWGTLLVWFLVTCAAYTLELTSINSASNLTIANFVGLTWLLLGLVTFVLQSPLRTPSVACNRVFGASLLIFLQAPLWLAESLSSNLSQPMMLALLVTAVAVHAAAAGVVVRICCTPNSRRTSVHTLLDRFFSADSRTHAALRHDASRSIGQHYSICFHSVRVGNDRSQAHCACWLWPSS